jgi:gliding motility-associated-like protein
MKSVLSLFILIICASAISGQCEECEYSSGNLVYNSDFELGDEGFTSELNPGVDGPYGLLSLGGSYAIGPDANVFHVNYSGNDHTNPPDGNFMVINGSTSVGVEAWCQTMDVLPNHDYTLSFWVIDVRTNAPVFIPFGKVQWKVNGVEIGPNVDITDDWQQVTAVWNSGAATTMEFCILNQVGGGSGNDYAIDDIEVQTCLTYDVAQIVDAGPDIELCHGDQAELGIPAFDNFTYIWELNGFLDNPFSANPSINVTNLGPDPIVELFTVYADTAFLGCIQTDVVQVTIYPLPTPDLGDDLVICPGEETVLDAGPGWENITWSTSENTETITASIPDTYTVTVTLNGCENSDDILIEQPDLPIIELGPDTSICEDGFFIFEAGVSGLWSTGNTESWIETNSEGTYSFTYEDLGCIVSDSVFLDVIQYPEIELGEDFILCPDTIAVLDIGYPGQWGDGSFGPEFIVEEPGFYSVIASDQQCSTYDAVTVIGLEYPEIDLGPDLEFCQGDPQVEFGSDAEQNHLYTWSTGDTTNWVDLDYTHFLTVSVTNMCGSASDTVSVIYEDCGYDLFIPNAFTPNGDGVNETLEVFTHNFEHFEIFIFDRWGNMVFTSNDPERQWIGDVMGGGYFVPNDTYFYRVEGQSIKKHIIRKNGWVTVIR